MQPDKKHVRISGYVLSFVLTFLAVRFWIKHDWHLLPLAMFATASLLFSLATFKWEKLVPFCVKLNKVASFVGRCLTGVVLSFVFYLIFGFSGLVLRLLRKDILDRKIDPQKESYWEKNETEEFDTKRYLQQF